MDHIGFLTGSVGDAAYVAEAVLPGTGLLFACGMPVDGLRIGVPLPGFSDAAPAVANAVHHAIENLSGHGATIVELEAPSNDDFELSNAAGLIVSRAEALEYHRSLGTDFGRLWTETADQLHAAQDITLREYFVAQRFRSEFGARMVALMDSIQLDALVMPTTLVTAPLVEDAERHFTALSRNAIPWSLLGWPVVSVPCGCDEQGLPIGLQVVATPHEDGQALRVARAVG
jgi:aspartyl-tRNA(Asn)/glutamyl-tRNA(Gln) amidotransferase subunit A